MARNGDRRVAQSILVVKPDGKKFKEETIVTKDNIELDLQNIWPVGRGID